MIRFVLMLSCKALVLVERLQLRAGKIYDERAIEWLRMANHWEQVNVGPLAVTAQSHIECKREARYCRIRAARFLDLAEAAHQKARLTRAEREEVEAQLQH